MPAGNFADTKILVIMLKDGGEDSLHRFIPRNATMLTDIAAFRPTLGFTNGEVSGYTGGHIDADWCLHPELNPLKAVWDAGDMAITHRVGNMFTDLASKTIAQVRAATKAGYTGDIVFPKNLGAHDFQQISAVSMITQDFVDQFGAARTIGEGGFIGRLLDAFRAFSPALGTGGQPSTLPLAYAAGQLGTARNLISRSGLNRALDLPLVGGRFNRAWSASVQQTSALSRLDAIMAQSQTETRRKAFRDIADIMRLSVAFFQPVIETAYDGTPPATYDVDQYFVDGVQGGWRGIMHTFARAIEDRAGGLGLPNRMVFIGNISGYDTHFSQGKLTGALPTLFTDEAKSVVQFRNAMINMPGGSLWNNTLIVDWSEFSRTLLENGSAGTDHAYARTCSAYGGAVIGGHFGTPITSYDVTQYDNAGTPTSGDGSHDINGGQLGAGSISPGISSEQYWSRILEWFGADSNDLTAALPRRASFGSPVALI